MTVREIQQRLSDLGYAIEVDGVSGPQTKATIKQFQRDRGLVADGVVGPKTESALKGDSVSSAPAVNESNFQRSLRLVLEHEGGFVDHPRDPGGVINKGVTLYTFRLYVDPNGSVDDLKNIKDAQLETVYGEQYWDKLRCDDLPGGVDYAVFDFGVNSGPRRSAQFIQRIAGVDADGVIGPATVRAIKSCDAAKLVDDLCDARLAFLKGLNTWDTFGHGWSRRVEGVRKHAKEMVA